MIPYSRKRPEFSLCGLNCSLCPRFHTEGTSRCPGCGGSGFSLKHPSCGVISCARKNGDVEYCFECAKYPCEKYARDGGKDSFITYKKVAEDIAAAKADIEAYLAALGKKEAILRELIARFDNGRMKGYYCLAVNLLPLDDLAALVDGARAMEVDDKDSIASALKEGLREIAARRGIDVALRR